MPRPRTLRVLPNPYVHIDHEGRPSGVVPWDPTHNPDRGFVGATLKADVTQTYPEGDGREQVQDTRFEFTTEPVTLPDTPYYRQALTRGELLAADQDTAREVGVEWTEPHKALGAARTSAADMHQARHGYVPDALADAEPEPEPQPQRTPGRHTLRPPGAMKGSE